MSSRTVEIYDTMEYSIFKRLLGNRHIRNNRVAIIKASIENKGYISNPIIVNEKMEVIDGQGRVEALRQLNMPVEYRILPGLGIEECRAMNLKPTAWTIEDFVESYAESGNENYARLKGLHEGYGFGYTLLFYLGRNLVYGGGSAQSDLRNGTYKLNQSDSITLDEMCQYLTKFKDVKNKVGGKSDLFYGCVGWCASQEGVDKARLCDALHQGVATLSPVSQTEPFLREISGVYNANLPRNKRRWFDYEWRTKDDKEVEA